MTENNRVFPRIPTGKMKIAVELYRHPLDPSENIIPITPRMVNAGLDGILLQSDKKYDFRECDKIKIAIGKKTFIITGQQQWDAYDDGKHSYMVGVGLHFNDLNDFNKWLKFITALDLFKKKL